MKKIIEDIDIKDNPIILIDCGMFLIPYLKYKVITYGKYNITPFCKLLEFYFKICQYSNSRFLLFIDNGILDSVRSIYKFYKAHRKHSKRCRVDRIYSDFYFKDKDYVLNRNLIGNFFMKLGYGVFGYGEADYQIGYILNLLINNYNYDSSCLYVVSHDNDLFALNEFANIIKKSFGKRGLYSKFELFHINSYELVESDFRISSYNEYIIKKALLGDIVDNIPPVLLMDKRKVKKIFNKYKFEYGFEKLDYKNTLKIIKEKILNNKNKHFFEKIKNEFIRNYRIFDIYNSSNLFSTDDLNYMNNILETFFNRTRITSDELTEALKMVKMVSKTYANMFLRFIEIKKRRKNYV